MYLVIIPFKANILNYVHDINTISSCFIENLQKQSGIIKISDYTINPDGVYIVMKIINNINSPAVYVAKKDNKIIADFVRQYKLAVNRRIAEIDLWQLKYKVQIIDKAKLNKR